MLTSLAVVFLLGMFLGWLLKLLHLPSLTGFLIAGMALGPYALNRLDPSLLLISPDLRRIALIIILLRAGLSLDFDDLRKTGRSAVLICFLPACCEIAGTLLLAPRIFGISLLEAAVLGTVLAAVSPAVIVPKMLMLMEEGYGTAKGIPQMILAGASVDDVFVIVLFTAFTGLARGEGVGITAPALLKIPLSILLGIAVGALLGVLFASFFRHIHLRDTAKVLLLISTAFLLVTLETALEGIVGFSGLLAVMAMGALLYKRRPRVAERLSRKFSKLWVAAEILLFVLVGATVDLTYAAQAGNRAVLLVGGILLFRTAGVILCTLGSPLTNRERLFCAIAYLPKATVQAAIGALPLSMGLPCGPLVLSVAVLSILLTAPLGALGIDLTYCRLLTRDGG